MSVCAVIVSYRTGDALKACLAALLAAENLEQIVIADNGNDAGAEAILNGAAERDARVRILRGQGRAISALPPPAISRPARPRARRLPSSIPT
ncbi:MAG: glycosyltransferase [Caulobacteraceae bacterium]|nr:glycosyltransferase [Caulobacteraceae bacterium]